MLQYLLLTSMDMRALQIFFCLLHNQDLCGFLQDYILCNWWCETSNKLTWKVILIHNRASTTNNKKNDKKIFTSGIEKHFCFEILLFFLQCCIKSWWHWHSTCKWIIRIILQNCHAGFDWSTGFKCRQKINLTHLPYVFFVTQKQHNKAGTINDNSWKCDSIKVYVNTSCTEQWKEVDDPILWAGQ